MPSPDLALTLIADAVSTVIDLLMASIRPFRYTLSASYRRKVNSEFESRSRLTKIAHLIGGAVLLLMSIAIISGCAYLYITRGKPEPTVASKAISMSAKAIGHVAHGVAQAASGAVK